MNSRFLSRKFIVTLIAQVVALVALFLPAKAEKAEAVGKEVAAVVLSLVSIAGYVRTEGAIDKARVEGEVDERLAGGGE
jgi:hypothetical protein